MKATVATATRKFIGSALAPLAGMFAFFLTMVSVPAISESSGIAGGYVAIAVLGVTFVIAVVATRWAKSPNAKKAAEDK